MTSRATSAFDITAWDETADDEQPAVGPRLSRATVRKTFTGEVAGVSTAELLLCQAEDGSGGYVALERFEGSLEDRAGSFVVQHGAARGNGMQTSFGFVVPGSATGALTGLFGDVTFDHDEDGASFTIEYAFTDE